MGDGIYQVIYTLVQAVPVGQVTTYGQIARLAGCEEYTIGLEDIDGPGGAGHVRALCDGDATTGDDGLCLLCINLVLRCAG